MFFIDIELPERRKLRVIPKNPHAASNAKPVKMTKRLDLIRGEEEIVTDFLHGQYGIVVSIFFLFFLFIYIDTNNSGLKVPGHY